jgi:cation diffusion facilitator CzcD-associated flavoprotein CzcO
MAEFSDSVLRLLQEVKTVHGFFPAKYVTCYLNEYVNSHVYGGKSLRDRILFQHKVLSARRSASEKWEILCNDSTTAFVASKLIVASGLTTTPCVPNLPDRAVFSGQILHQKAFGQSSFLSDPLVTNVAVLGGGKSAADIVYASAKAGKRVDWIMRKSGSGPAAHIKAESQGLYENPVAMFGTRMISSLTPSIFNSNSMSAHLLHRTKVGRKIVDWIWANVDRQNRAAAGYQSRKGEGSGFEKLEPDCP